LKITPEVKAFALEQADRRCECTGTKCRHHLRGARCKRGLRGDRWKVFWKSEEGGATRENIEAWCLECFANNFEAPREVVALLAVDIAGYGHLLEADRRRAITLRSVLRDATDRAARGFRGRVVLDRFDDDVLAEFAASRDAVEAARLTCSHFREMTVRLDLEPPEICGAIHCGEVTRWRNGVIVGDAIDITTSVRSAAGHGQIVITGSAAAPLGTKVTLEPVAEDSVPETRRVGGIWLLPL